MLDLRNSEGSSEQLGFRPPDALLLPQEHDITGLGTRKSALNGDQLLLPWYTFDADRNK